MRRRALLLLGASALATLAASPRPVPSYRRTNVTGRPIICYSPHQDDLLLFGGRIAAHHTALGVDRRLITVTGTDGSTSTVLAKLNGAVSSAYWGGLHNPGLEGYGLLTPADIAAARDREDRNANRLLGAASADIHHAWTVPHQGGTLSRGANISVEEAESLIGYFDDQYPDAGHYAMWPGDQDPNHRNLGQALLNLHTADPVKYNDVRWLVRPSEHVAAGALTYAVPAAYTTDVNARVRRACRAYDAWAPHEGMYAVGYHSVQSLFQAVVAGEPNYYLKPDAPILDAYR